MKFTVTIDRDEDGVWIVECPPIPGCISRGATKVEAIENINDAITLCLEVRSERAIPLDIESREVEVSVSAVAGMWKDTTDLPTRQEFRDEWEERLQRLGLGD